MDEMSKGLANSIEGPEADSIKTKIEKQLQSWGLIMPPVQPMMFDFGLGNFSMIGETEFWIANETAYGYCGKYLFLFKGQQCPEHMHRKKHETFFIVKGKVRMFYDGKEWVMNAGDILAVEQMKYHSFLAESNVLILEVSMPGIIADNYFSDPRLGYDGKT